MEKTAQGIKAILPVAKSKVSICAVIVTYHPAVEIIENVSALLEQVDVVVLVDNGSGLATKGLLDKLRSYAKVSVIYNQENLGIAAALNIGVKKAKDDGYQWVATFDQDSQATPHMIEMMLQAYGAYPQKEKIASLSPRYKDKNTGVVSVSQATSFSGDRLPYIEVEVIITSGNLVKTSVFDTVGYFSEELFIDYVDTEYCLRCITHGYKILEVIDAILLHDVGTPSQHNLFWKKFIISNHSALRRYYFARNAIYTYRRYILKQPLWIIKNAYILVKIAIMVALFETDRRKKMAALIRGFVDGLLGKMGKCSRTI